MFKYTENGCVVDQDGFIVAEFTTWQDARTSCRQANEQARAGEQQEVLEARLRGWAHDIMMEDEAENCAAIHYAD
jgi:hypothetical protein